MEKDGSNRIPVMEDLRWSYLDVVGETVYVSRRIDDDPYCADAYSLFAIDANVPDAITVAKEAMPSPVQHLGDRILCRNLNGLYSVSYTHLRLVTVRSGQLWKRINLT